MYANVNNVYVHTLLKKTGSQRRTCITRNFLLHIAVHLGFIWVSKGLTFLFPHAMSEPDGLQLTLIFSPGVSILCTCLPALSTRLHQHGNKVQRCQHDNKVQSHNQLLANFQGYHSLPCLCTRQMGLTSGVPYADRFVCRCTC